ncbi:DUF2852 domain-containing protein [Gemmobacter fulvus]|nr:DUF2852 domain-containing protein [Gemmobacter fulvus]MDQ1848226.1 DUF2852 domain-containing protein [Gemmobacter fulvus]
MYTAYPSAAMSGRPNILRRAEAWLDSKGRPAWFAAMILGFVFVWPVGLALLAYMIWSKRMFSKSACSSRRATRFGGPFSAAGRSSGNSAFDAYKSEMLKRLEDEQEAFESFLQRLRDAKDKQEFDSFMDDRARKAAEPVTEPAVAEAPKAGAY